MSHVLRNPVILLSICLSPLIFGFLKNLSSSSACHVSAVPTAAVRARCVTCLEKSDKNNKLENLGEPLAFVRRTGAVKHIWSVNIHWNCFNVTCIAAIK